MNIQGYQPGRKVAVEECCTIFNALEIESSKTVTIKFFQQELSENLEFSQHFQKISELLLNKKVGKIIVLKKAICKADSCYLITEYFPYSQNKKPLQTAFTVYEVLNFGHQLAYSLSQLHDIGLVHGAVSTANLKFPNFSQVSLGLASFTRTFKNNPLISNSDISLNELAFIAPEFSTGLDARSDFYSLGVVLYELLFKAKPFIAENSEQLQNIKQNMQFSLPHDSAQKLAPLFNRLLTSNPEQRISSVDEFIRVAEQCGYTFNDTDTSENTTTQSTVFPARSRPVENQTKTIFFYSAFAGILMVAILTFFIFDEPEVEVIKSSISEPSLIAIAPVEKVRLRTVSFNTPDSKSVAHSLFLKGQQQIDQNNFGAALMSINNALKEQPDHADAQQLKKQIELEFEIRTYLSKAEKQISQRRLTRPVNENAYSTYKKLATLLPAGDNRAIEGYQKIVTRYYQLANALILKKQFEAAQNYISAGLSINPDDLQLIQLNRYNQLKLADQNKFQTEQGNLQQAALLEHQRQQKIVEKSRLAALEKAKVRKLQQQQEQLKVDNLRIERNKNDQLINDARNLLRKNQPSLQSLNHALGIHHQLTNSTLQDVRIDDLLKQIIRSFVELAQKQQSISDFEEALDTIKRGLALDEDNNRLLQIKQDINVSIAAKEEKKNQGL